MERHRRTYEDACGAAFALDLVGERWALLVIRELMFGPRRFSDLRASLPGISANVLTQRLEGLETAGVLVRRRLPPPASVQVYELTAWGYEAEPIFQVLGRWAVRSPAHDPTRPLSAASLFLSFRTMFVPDKAAGLTSRIGFRIGEDSFVVAVAEGALTAVRAACENVDVLFVGSPPAIAAAVHGGVPLARLEAEGLLSIEGNRGAAERFTRLFAMPPKFDVPGAPQLSNRSR
jgi:DNA-binding HxlR family transcriptional regulator